MGFIEGIFGEINHIVVNLVGRLFVDAVGDTAGYAFFPVSVNEILALFLHDGRFLL